MKSTPFRVVAAKHLWAVGAIVGSVVSRRLYYYCRMRCLEPWMQDGEEYWPRTPADYQEAIEQYTAHITRR